jgi:hypothetical protein
MISARSMDAWSSDSIACRTSRDAEAVPTVTTDVEYLRKAGWEGREGWWKAWTGMILS